MNNFSRFGVGTDNTVLAAYAYSTNTNDRIGPVDLQFENLGQGKSELQDSLLGDSTVGQSNVATLIVKQWVNAGTVTNGIYSSGYWSPLISSFGVNVGGRVTTSAVIFANKIGIFGSGNCQVSMHIPQPYAAALRGGHIDIVPVGRQNWSFDTGIDSTQNFPNPLS